MDVAKIGILVEANSSGVGSGLAPGLQSLNKFVNDVETSLKRVGSAWSGLSTGQQVLAGFGVAAGLAAVAISSTIKPAIEFESAFAGVRKTVDGTAPQLEKIRTGIIDMSKEMPTAAKDLALIAENAGQLGVKAPDILNFTRVVAQLGETTDLSFDQAASELARFLNITGGGAALIDPVSNALVALGNAGASTESEIVNFSQRLASAVTVAGGSEDQILALASAFSSFGVNAEAGGSALSTIITSISDSARGGNGHLATYARTAGLLPEQFRQIALSNPVEALILFGEGLGGIVRAGGSVTPVMEQLELGGLRTTEVMRLLALNSGSVRDALKLAAEEMAGGTARQDEYDKRLETTAAKLERLKNNITAIQIEVGSTFLKGIAEGADLAGKGIDQLVEILRPLAGELVELFGNGVDLASAFWSAVGGPGAQAAVAILIGVTATLTAVLDVINGFGPAGLAIGAVLATLAGFGPAVRPLVSVVDSLSASIYRIATAGSAARGGLQSFVEFGQTAFLGVLTVALVSLGEALYNAGKKAEESGKQFQDAWGEALKANDFDAAVEQIQKVRSEMQRMDEIDKVSKGWGGGWDSWSTALRSSVQLLTPFTENTVVNARAEMEKLKEVAENNGFDVFESRVSTLAQQMGISEDSTLRLANQMGLLDAVTTGTAEEFAAARNAMDIFVNGAEAVADVMNLSKQELIDNVQSLGELSDALGVTEENLAFVAQGIDGLKFEDLFDGDPEVRMGALSAVAAEVQGKFAILAEQVGLTTDEFIGQVAALGDLTAANKDLEAAISGVIGALEAVNAPQEAYNKAIGEFEEKIKTAGTGMEEFEVAAAAGREAIARFAGTAPEFDVLIEKQKELAVQLYNAALQFTGSKELAAQYVAELFGIPASALTTILLEAEKAKADAEQVKGDLNDVDGAVAQAILDADPELARLAFEEMRLAKTDFVAPVATSLAVQKSEAEAAFESMRLAKTDFIVPATVPIRADISDAIAHVQNIDAVVGAFVGAKHEAQYTANNEDAVNKANVAAATGQGFAAGKYLAHYQGDNSDALAKANQATGEAVKYGSQRPRAILSAQDNASGVIQGALNKLNQFQSKSITITSTTINKSVSASAQGPLLEGGIIGPNGARSFATGGFYGGGASNLISSIASGAARYDALPGLARIFAEPATGREWYLPERGNPERTRSIWRTRGGSSGSWIVAAVRGW